MRIRTQPLFNNYNKYGYIETTYIAIARPGKRLLGVLNGVDESTCRLEINLNNTAVLTFDVNRFVNNNQESQFYNRIEQLMELEIPGVGWFKINEQPTISGDGNKEIMSVRAESLEIELAQYFIKGMEINMGTVSSAEMIATDNTYKAGDGTDSQFAWTNVRFYKDTSQLEELISVVDDNWTEQDLVNAVSEYPCLWNSWRMTYDPGSFKNAINDAADNMTDLDRAKTLRSYEDRITTQQTMYFLSQSYPEVCDYLVIISVDLNEYDELTREETGNTLTIPEMLQLELKRQKDLSMMDIVLEETDWSVGFVDDSVLSESDDEDDLVQLKDKVGCFEIGSSNVYNFLMQEASPYFRCIYVFDTINKKVNCYNVNNLGEDTNIIINFANIQNSVERSDDDAIKTVFHVNGGDDLDIRYANLGEETIIDLSYYMNEDHFNSSTIAKYNEWVNQREELRRQYMDLSVAYYNKLEDIAYIEDRVPADGADSNQYFSFTENELLAERENYKAVLRALQSYYVDDNNDFSIEALKQNPTDYNEYIYITTVILSNPLTALDLVYYDPVEDDYLIEGYPYGDDLDDPSKGRLGQIDLVLLNRYIADGKYVDETDDREEREKKTSYKQQKEYLENYMYDFKTYGDSYGLNELKVRRDDLNNKIQSLRAKGYTINPSPEDDETDTENPIDSEETDQDEIIDNINEYDDDYHRRKYELYLKYKKSLEQLKVVLAQRQQEYDDAKQELQDIADQQIALKEQADISNPIYGFTPEELEMMKEYYVHTDYVNENLIVTDIDTAQEIVDTEDELYKLAQEELYAASHPQWRWTTSQSNLFLMPEFKNWHSQLDIGNYITIGMEQNPQLIHPELYKRNNINYFTKLRVVSIGLNPFMIEPDIDITFSSIVQYKSKQNDFVDLFELNTGVGDSQISSYFNSKHLDGSYSIDSSFLLKLLRGGMQSYIETTADNSAMDAYQSAIGPGNRISDWVINTGANNDRIIQSWITDDSEKNTTVTGGSVITNSIYGRHLAIDEIMSNNYSGADVSQEEYFSDAGTYWNLQNGSLISPGFSIINTNTGTNDNPIWSSNAYFKGNVTALSGFIGGTSSTNAWEITSGKIETMYEVFTGDLDENNEPIYANRYMGMAIDGTGQAFYANAQTSGGEDGVFRVGHDGILHAVGAEIEGDITASTLTCKDGNNETKLSWDGSTLAVNGDITANTLNCGNKLVWNGSILTVDGEINASSGTIGGCPITSGSLQVDSAHITSVNADKINAGTITGININGTNITGTSTITGASISGGSIQLKGGSQFSSITSQSNLYISSSYVHINNGSNSYVEYNLYGIFHDNAYRTGTAADGAYSAASQNTTDYWIWGSGLKVTGSITSTGYLHALNVRLSQLEHSTGQLAVTAGPLGGLNTSGSSSIRYKNIISKITNNDVKKLYEIPVYNFQYKDGYLMKGDEREGIAMPGFIAEDWEDIMPIAVDHLEDGKPEMWNKNIVIPLMFQMIKNDHEEIQQLKDRIKELENKLQ